jgi:type II secretory pathway pseudopilin PulG
MTAPFSTNVPAFLAMVPAADGRHLVPWTRTFRSTPSTKEHANSMAVTSHGSPWRGLLRRPRLEGRTGPIRTRRGRVLAVMLAGAVLVLTAAVGLQTSLAVFSDAEAVAAQAQAKAIFAGERVTSAFDVSDRSSGSAVNRSSSFAVASDVLTTTTSAWSTAFSGSRYLEFDLNSPMPGGLALSAGTFTFRFASAAGGGTACYYFEVRLASTSAVLATHGSSGTPLACVTGTTQATTSTAIASVTGTDISNDLRIRIYGRDSAGSAMVIDRAVVTASTAYNAFTLFPDRFVDAADTTVDIIPWELSGP